MNFHVILYVPKPCDNHKPQQQNTSHSHYDITPGQGKARDRRTRRDDQRIGRRMRSETTAKSGGNYDYCVFTVEAKFAIERKLYSLRCNMLPSIVQSVQE